MTLTEFLLARITEDEAWAQGCEGLHWEWRDNDTDEPVTPDPFVKEYVDDERRVSLRSVEQFPYRSIPGEGPRFLIHNAEECSATTAGHVIRHDPARVLAECAAKRRIVEREQLNMVSRPDGFPWYVATLAAIYADHPDYRQEWRP